MFGCIHTYFSFYARLHRDIYNKAKTSQKVAASDVWQILHVNPNAILPKNLCIVGDLYCSDAHDYALPNGLRVEGHLNPKGSHTKLLPQNLWVEGDLNIENTPITQLPKDSEILGNIDAQGSLLRTIPEDYTVHGSLDLAHTPITVLPKLHIGGNLLLSDSAVHTMSPHTEIQGALALARAPIQVLPPYLSVGHLNLELSNVVKISEYTNIYSGLWLTETVETLSVGLHVADFIQVSTSKITQLPEGIQCSYLDMGRAHITRLPEHIECCISPTLYLKDIQNYAEKIPIHQGVVLKYERSASAHQTAQLHKHLQDFPDILRILLLFDIPVSLHIGRDAAGPDGLSVYIG